MLNEEAPTKIFCDSRMQCFAVIQPSNRSFTSYMQMDFNIATNVALSFRASTMLCYADQMSITREGITVRQTHPSPLLTYSKAIKMVIEDQ